MDLHDSKLFDGIKDEEANLLLNCLGAVQKDFKKGETIMREGTLAKQFGLVISGTAIMSYIDAWGNASILGSAGQGDVFAEAYACAGKPLMVLVYAAEDTRVLFMDVEKILSTCTNACGYHFKLITNLLSVCANKSLQLSRRICHTGSKTIRGRLMSYFSECIKRSGGRTFQIKYSRQQLADYLGVDRSAMCNELSKMRREGLIEYERNYFKILKIIEENGKE